MAPTPNPNFGDAAPMREEPQGDEQLSALYFSAEDVASNDTKKSLNDFTEQASKGVEDGGGSNPKRSTNKSSSNRAILNEEQDLTKPLLDPGSSEVDKDQDGNNVNSDAEATKGNEEKNKWLNFSIAGCSSAANEANPHSSIPSCYSLALFSTTPLLIRILVPFFLICSHCMFMYGQYFPMWRLTMSTNITDIWVNATTFSSREAFDILQQPHENYFDVHQNKTVENFTYGDAITKLWIASGLPSKTGPRFSAVLLVIFSGVWPHLKLFLLQMYWWIPRFEKERTTCFYWLSTFGKWSFADVFVVCIMIGVLNLDLYLNPDNIKEGLINQMPAAIDIAKSRFTPEMVCDQALKMTCSEEKNWIHKGECGACKGLINQMYNHPGFAQGRGRSIMNGVKTSGDGHVSIRIVGLSGIYFFCVAVLLSLLIGVMIDWYDHKARVKNADCRRALAASSSASSNASSLLLRLENGNQGDGFQDEENGDSSSALVSMSNSSGNEKAPERRSLGDKVKSCCADMKWLNQRLPTSFITNTLYVLLIVFTAGTAKLVYLGITEDTMERVVKGAIPKLSHEILGITWYRPYSLWTLVEVSGAAGGWDILLMCTFATFVVFGPIIRCGLIALTQVLPMTKALHSFFINLIRIVGAFCAWEVFCVAGFMVMLEMPSITNTIIEREECGKVSEDGSCLDVEYNFTHDIWMVVVGGFFLVVNALITTRMGFRALDPYHDGDLGGPYWCCDCSSGRSTCGCFKRCRRVCCRGRSSVQPHLSEPLLTSELSSGNVSNVAVDVED